MPISKPARLNLRVSAASDELIREAASLSGQSVTEYVTDAAVQRARQVVAHQRHFELGDEAWDRFIAALDASPRFNQRLANLFSLPPLYRGIGSAGGLGAWRGISITRSLDDRPP